MRTVVPTTPGLPPNRFRQSAWPRTILVLTADLLLVDREPAAVRQRHAERGKQRRGAEAQREAHRVGGGGQGRPGCGPGADGGNGLQPGEVVAELEGREGGREVTVPVVVQADHAIGLAEVEGREQDAAHDAEDGGGGPDAHRQRRDDREGERRAAQQGAQRDLQLVQKERHPAIGSKNAASLLHSARRRQRVRKRDAASRRRTPLSRRAGARVVLPRTTCVFHAFVFRALSGSVFVRRSGRMAQWCDTPAQRLKLRRAARFRPRVLKLTGQR